MTASANWNRVELEHYLALLLEQERRARERTRTRLQVAQMTKTLTPETVADFAWLHITDDNGRPIRPAAHHWLWLHLMCNEDIKKLLLIAPPESAKTTWVLAYTATHIAFYPEWPRIMAAVSGEVASKRSQSLRLMMESAVFQVTFPDIKRAVGLKWTQEEWSVAPHGGLARPGRIHPTLFATGVGGSIIGSRARLLIADDILDQDNTRTAHQRDLVHTWFHSSFLSRRMARVGRAIVIGNAWHHDDTYSRMKQAGDWVVCHIPLLAEGGGPDGATAVYANIYYPEKYQGERLGRPVASVVNSLPSFPHAVQ